MKPSHSHKTADHIPIMALFAANAISMIGNMVAMIAIPWFVLKTTGSPSQMGITGFFNILPVVLAGLLGGALVDRIGYKGTSIIADIASGIAVVLIPILYSTIGLPFWALMVLVFLGALLDAPGGTARAALVPDLADLAWARASVPTPKGPIRVDWKSDRGRAVGRVALPVGCSAKLALASPPPGSAYAVDGKPVEATEEDGVTSFALKGGRTYALSLVPAGSKQ